VGGPIHSAAMAPTPPRLTDSTTSWGAVTRWLHWGTTGVVGMSVLLGLWLARQAPEYGQTPTWLGAAAHHTLGFLVLVATMVRGNWRINNERPAHPAAMGPSRRRLASVVQGSLYVLLVVMPLSGWAALTTTPVPTPLYFFGWQIPRMFEDPPSNPLVHDVFAWAHWACFPLLALIVGGHVVGALISQFIDGDEAITRMWRGHRVQAEPPRD